MARYVAKSRGKRRFGSDFHGAVRCGKAQSRLRTGPGWQGPGVMFKPVLPYCPAKSDAFLGLLTTPMLPMASEARPVGNAINADELGITHAMTGRKSVFPLGRSSRATRRRRGSGRKDNWNRPRLPLRRRGIVFVERREHTCAVRGRPAAPALAGLTLRTREIRGLSWRKEGPLRRPIG